MRYTEATYPLGSPLSVRNAGAGRFCFRQPTFRLRRLQHVTLVAIETPADSA